ncbi:VRR-NUC domain-containing protein [Roseomonas mucosa]|uniref:VRR-NUC domain-containing protein n=1 Tax=Roseomonas mucosa TaxID=207340 RepID=UPI002247C840|nr:VRR-NUC domain-containing protein [Roseomonas mucosa]UZO91739.1 Hypothetical protein RMP42_06010 [Roseomonas mucosa]
MTTRNAPLSEAEIQAAIMRDLGRGDTRLFRNTVGQGWTGQASHLREPGCVLIRNARAVRFGLADGSGDLIGWRSMLITPEHVGTTLAVFLSVEVKSSTGSLRDGQRVWAQAVARAGGLAGTARSVEEARAIARLGTLL